MEMHVCSPVVICLGRTNSTRVQQKELCEQNSRKHIKF